MEECPYLLQVDEITETCVGAEGKRWYHVRWKSTWISDDVIPPKIFKKTQNGKVHFSGNNMLYEILEEKQNENGRVEFLLSCTDSWENEDHLTKTFSPAISKYWASKAKKTEDLIKIEETSDDESQTCCFKGAKKKKTEQVVNLIPAEPSVKDENQKRFSQCCSEEVIRNPSSEVDIPMQHLHLATPDVLTPADIEETLQTLDPSIGSSNISPNHQLHEHDHIKPEEPIRNTCSNQTSNENTRSISPVTYPLQNSCLPDDCDIPADRYSPKILKIEDEYSNPDENESSGGHNTPSLPNLHSTFSSDFTSPSSSLSSPPKIPAHVEKTNFLSQNHELGLLSYNTSTKQPPAVIKIEDDDDEPASCSRQPSLIQPRSFSSFSSLDYKHMPHIASAFPAPTPKPSFANNIQSNVPSIICKTEVDDYPINNVERSPITPFPPISGRCSNPPAPFPPISGRCSNPPELINMSNHIPPGMIKTEDNLNPSCHQRCSTDMNQTRLDGNRPDGLPPVDCSCSFPDKPPLLIHNSVALPSVPPPNVSRGMNRYNENFNANRLCHHNQMISPTSNNEQRRLQMAKAGEANKCDICGQMFVDFNALYQHRLSHGKDYHGPPMINIKQEKDLDFVNESPSNPCSNPYFPPNSSHVPPNYVHKISRNEEAYLSPIGMKQTKHFNPRIPNPPNFRHPANLANNPMIYTAQNQINPHHHALNKNKDPFHPALMRPPNHSKPYMPETILGAPSSFKPPNSRDSFLPVNDVAPLPYPPHPKVPNHRPPMVMNSEEERLRATDPQVNVQFCSAPNSYMMMNDHVMSMCKPTDYNSCISHDKMQQHRYMIQNSPVRPYQINTVEDHRFHPGNRYMPPNRLMYPGNYQPNPGPPTICPPTDKQPSSQQLMPTMAPNPSQVRYQNINPTNRQFYPTQNQQFFPPNSHLNNHIPNNVPPVLPSIPENFPQNHNDISSLQQPNGSREDHQISPPSYPKCDFCGKQFPNYITLNEHRASHLHNQGPRPPQIKEEPDADYMPTMSGNAFQKDISSEFIYPDQNMYMHRRPMPSANPVNDFPGNICKKEGQIGIQNPQIALGPRGVTNSGVYNIHQKETLPRMLGEQQQQHTSFIPNPDVSMATNPPHSDNRQITSIQNPYLLPNGHIISNKTYQTGNCKTEDACSSNMIPTPQVNQESLIQTSIQNPHPLVNATTEKTHKCDTCGETYTDYSKLKEHRKTHASEKQFSCELCDKTFTQNSTLKRHQRTHTREKPYKCEICGKSFSHNYNLKEHGKTHTGEKPYRCDICGKTFAQNYHLKEHQTTHSDAKPFKCDKCNKQFSLDSYLKKHQKIHTGEKPYKCDVCDKQFLQNSHLKDHRRIHTGEKPFKCEICGIRFSQNYTLKIHQRTHTGEKPYKCEICEKRFSQNSHLKEHRTRTHSGDKPFKCDQCHKEFSLDSYLKKHQKIHSGEKPFKCDICEKQFSQNYHLKEHRRIHTGEKPYKCQICEMRFSQNCSLKIHQRIHTGEKPYECEICGKQFSHSSNVKTHKRVHLTEKVKANVNQNVVNVSYPVSVVDSKVNILPTLAEIPQTVVATS